MKVKYYIVFNENKTIGFLTTDKQLAYETRKSSDSNCYTEEGECCILAQSFCKIYSEDNCTIKEILLDFSEK